MSELRRSRSSLFRGVLAVVDIDEPDRPVNSVRFFRELLRGATERAAELGFKVSLSSSAAEACRCTGSTRSCNPAESRALILLPVWGDLNSARLDWARYAGVYTEYVVDPACHCTGLFRSLPSMMTVLQTPLRARLPTTRAVCGTAQR